MSRATFTGWTCPQGPASLVDWLVDRGEEVSYHRFVRNVDVKTAPLEPWQIKILRTDWAVTFLVSDLPSGAQAWVMQHGGIEILFTKDPVDTYYEGQLAECLMDQVAELDLDVTELGHVEIEALLANCSDPYDSMS